MAKRITDLPSASQPTGNEMLPVVQGGENQRTSVGIAKVAQGFGALPANYPAGSISYVVDAVGGAQPAFSTGTQWKTFSGAIDIKTMGVGIWVVGVGPSNGPAHADGADAGNYFTSEDGITWNKSKIFFMDKGFANISYANGCFLAGGFYSLGLPDPRLIAAMETTSIDPRNQTTWHISLPYGHQEVAGTTPGSPTHYDDTLGTFEVPIFFAGGSGTQLIQNELPSAVTPDPAWPWLGQNIFDPPASTSVVGVGTAGVMEVRISLKDISVAGTPWSSCFLEVRSFGTTDYRPIDFDNVFSRPEVAAGLSLVGLVWGPIKQTAVQFAPGSG